MDIRGLQISSGNIVSNFIEFNKYIEKNNEVITNAPNNFPEYSQYVKFKDNLNLFSGSISKVSINKEKYITIIKYNYVKHLGEVNNDYLCPYCSNPLYQTSDKGMLDLYLRDYRNNNNCNFEEYIRHLEFYYKCNNFHCIYNNVIEPDGLYRKYEGEFPHLTYSVERLSNEKKTLTRLFVKRYYIAVNYFLAEVKRNFDQSKLSNLIEFLTFLELLFTPDPILLAIKVKGKMDDVFAVISISNSDKFNVIEKFISNYKKIKKFEEVPTNLIDTFPVNDLNYRELLSCAPFGISKIRSLCVMKLRDFGDDKLFIYVFLPYEDHVVKTFFEQEVEKINFKNSLLKKKYFDDLRKDDVISYINNLNDKNKEDNYEIGKLKVLFKKFEVADNPIGSVVDHFYSKLYDDHNYKRAWVLFKSNNFNYVINDTLRSKLKTQFNKADKDKSLKVNFEDFISFLKGYNIGNQGIIGLTSSNYLPEFIISTWSDPRMAGMGKVIGKKFKDDEKVKNMILALRKIFPSPSDLMVLPIRIKDHVIGCVTVYLRSNSDNASQLIFDNEKYLYTCISLLSLVKGFSIELEKQILLEYIDAAINRISNTEPGNPDKEYFEFLQQYYDFLPKIGFKLNESEKFSISDEDKGKYPNLNFYKNFFEKIYNLKKDKKDTKSLQKSDSKQYCRDNFVITYDNRKFTLTNGEDKKEFGFDSRKKLLSNFLNFLKTLDKDKVGTLSKNHKSDIMKFLKKKFTEPPFKNYIEGLIIPKNKSQYLLNVKKYNPPSKMTT